MTNDAIGLTKVEAKLTDLQAQVAEMTSRHEDPHYIIGWMEGGIRTALISISVWKDDQ